MDISKTFRAGTTSSEPRWFEHGDARFLVTAISSPEYQEGVARLNRPHRKLLRRALRPTATEATVAKANEVQEDIARKALSQLALKGWENVELNGKPVAFTPEAAEAMMKDYPQFGELVAQMAEEAGELDEEAADPDEEALEQAKKPSDGSASGASS